MDGKLSLFSCAHHYHGLLKSFIFFRVIQKCANVMKGQCCIKFEESRTVFTLDIPAKPWGSTKVQTSIDVKTFRLPADTWGFCIDDSKIQQKLMVGSHASVYLQQ